MPGTIEEAKVAIAESSPESRIYLGCDSIRFSKRVNNRKVWYARYSTVVILHVDGNHGCKLFHRIDTLPDYGSIKQRMLNEVMFAVEIGSDVIEHVGDRHFSIHIDVNQDERHKSHAALSEARGWVLGTLGIEPVFKPDSLAASHAADHLVRM